MGTHTMLKDIRMNATRERASLQTNTGAVTYSGHRSDLQLRGGSQATKPATIKITHTHPHEHCYKNTAYPASSTTQ